MNIRDPHFVRLQIAKGLRASLELESFITGRLYVQFDYQSNPAQPVLVQKQGARIEIPTISTGLSEFLSSLERVDLPGLSPPHECVAGRSAAGVGRRAAQGG